MNIFNPVVIYTVILDLCTVTIALSITKKMYF